MKININGYVEVDLTDHGISILKRSIHYSEYTKLTGSRLKEQLWVVMNIFGEHIFNGAKQVFDGNLLLIDPPRGNT